MDFQEYNSTELWPGGLRIIKNGKVFPLGMDAVLLASFAGQIPALKVCDLGCGSGIIALLILKNDGQKTALGIEIQKEAVDTARINTGLNSMSGRFAVIQGDLRDFRTICKPGEFDLTVSNPPYFPEKSGKPPAAEGMAVARGERLCTLSDICAAAAYVTRFGGKFAMVQRPERLSEALCELTAAGLEPKRLRMVQPGVYSEPCLFLLECRRGGKRGIKIEPPLILKDENGQDTIEIKDIYHLT